MKKIIVLLLIFITALGVYVRPIVAQEKKDEELVNQITDLKDKIASRVAELNLVDKKGIIGTVDSSKSTQITVTDINGDTQIIDVDELTEFESSKDDFGISDIKPGMSISIIGRYNKQSERLLARFVEEFEIPLYLSGKVTDLDEDEHTIDIKTNDGNVYKLDYEKTTKTNIYEDDDTTKSGFSGIKIDERILVTGYRESKEGNVKASRILILNPESNSSKSDDK